ncbi:MAG: hypothetical protein LLG00_04665 [Planctomycetaceae bacterium]|nr:hypothetical protein [Planctomycetaceae bacterium]
MSTGAHVTVTDVLSNHRLSLTGTQRHGAVRGINRLAYRAAQRLLTLEIANIVAIDLSAISDRPLESSRFEFRFLSANEIRLAAADPASDLDGVVPESVEVDGNWCLAALDDGKVVNYTWYAAGHSQPQHSFGVGLALPTDTAYLYKGFTRPEYRGRRLQEATIRRAAELFRPMGIRRFVAMIEYGNWSSLRCHDRIGFRRVGRLCRLAGRLVRWRCAAEVGVARQS